MDIAVQREADVPLYEQIVRQIRDRIGTGELRPGDRLPPVRELAGQLGLTRLTVHSAYAELQSQGLLEATVGRGTYVTAGTVGARSAEAERPASWSRGGVLAELLSMTDQPGMLSFTQAMPDPATYPTRELSAAVRRAAHDSDSFSYGPIAGDAGLREELSRILRSRHLKVSAEHMLLTAGAQQGIDIVVRALVGPDELILCEAPTYPGLLELAAHSGRRVVGIPTDREGIRVDAFEAACAAYRPRLLYLVPAFANPTGAVLSPGRHDALLRVAGEYDVLVLEDDIYGWLAYDGSSPAPLKSRDRGDRVIYLLSFSKMLAPGLRLGVLAAPPALLPALSSAKASSDLVGSTLLQRALTDFLRRGYLEPHIASVVEVYRARRDALVAALEQHLAGCAWTYPAGGLSLWVTLPEGVEERQLVQDAIRAGVGVAPGRAFFAAPQPGGSMRLSFGAHRPDQIGEGMAMLGEVVRRHVQRRTDVFSRASRMVSPLV